MSDFSNSFPADTDRAAARLAVLAPGGRTEVFRGEAGDVAGLDAFAVIAAGRDPQVPAGFVLTAAKAHRVASTLGSLIHERWMGLPLPGPVREKASALCRVSGIASVVGARTTWQEVRGWREHYFVRAEAVASRAVAGRCWDQALSTAGLGHLPLVGATAASATVCVIGLLLAPFLQEAVWRASMALLAVLATVLCVAGEKHAQRLYLAEDPREVVLDEVAGMAVALALAGGGWVTIAAAFVAFRFFDIFKFGVHWVERRGWPGGIVWDDVLAGLYAGALVGAASWALR